MADDLIFIERNLSFKTHQDCHVLGVKALTSESDIWNDSPVYETSFVP